MLTTSTFAEIGALIGDPARAGMLVALMDGRALTAGELAATAGVTPQTASSHLAQLKGAGLLVMERQGRHRYHRLATPEIARMVEGMMTVAAGMPKAGARRVRTGPADAAMRRARTCYDHLAGRVAVGIADAMVARGEIILSADGGELTSVGLKFLLNAGIEVYRGVERPRTGRAFCRPCLDWSERRPHLAGAVGAALLRHFMTEAWIRRTANTRTATITPDGRRNLAGLFGLEDGTFA